MLLESKIKILIVSFVSFLMIDAIAFGKDTLKVINYYDEPFILLSLLTGVMG